MQINIDLIYPIGSIYMSTNTISPDILFGGKWERIKGRCIVGVDEGDSDFGVVSKTGGEKTHKLVVNEMPTHYHSIKANASTQVTKGSGAWVMNYSNDVNDNYLTDTGGDQPHNNLQPYYTAYVWRRVS